MPAWTGLSAGLDLTPLSATLKSTPWYCPWEPLDGAGLQLFWVLSSTGFSARWLLASYPLLRDVWTLITPATAVCWVLWCISTWRPLGSRVVTVWATPSTPWIWAQGERAICTSFFFVDVSLFALSYRLEFLLHPFWVLETHFPPLFLPQCCCIPASGCTWRVSFSASSCHSTVFLEVSIFGIFKRNISDMKTGFRKWYTQPLCTFHLALSNLNTCLICNTCFLLR